MYGTIAKTSDFESYVSLHQLDSIDEPEKTDYCINARNIAGCVLAITSIYGVVFYLLRFTTTTM
jgi:hypothetical protein